MAQNTWNYSMTCFLGLEYIILTYDYFCLHKNIKFWPKIGNVKPKFQTVRPMLITF